MNFSNSLTLDKYMASQRKTVQADRRKRPGLWKRCHRHYSASIVAQQTFLVAPVRHSQNGGWIVRMGRLKFALPGTLVQIPRGGACLARCHHLVRIDKDAEWTASELW